MPRVKESKIGKVLLKEIEPRKWRVDWRDPLTKKRHRVILPVADFKDAKKEADAISQQVAEGRGFRGRQRGVVGHLVGDAVSEAIKHSDANERTRRDYWRRFKPFAEYLATYAPGIKGWGDVTRATLENYIQHCRKADIAHDTLKSRIFVLRLTASYMSRTYGYANVTDGIRLRRHQPAKAELEAENSILSPASYRALLAWLRESEPMIYTLAVLQGCCGLRMLEASCLREGDIDPEAKTITIAATSAHIPKNRHSFRIIPVCDAVTEALAGWLGRLKVRHPEGFLFTPLRGNVGRLAARSIEARAGVWTRDSLTHQWRDALRAAEADEKSAVNIPEAFTARMLRASFVTALREAGADFAVLQKYIGHAPSSIMAAHYDKVDVERMKAIARLAQELFEGSGAFAEKTETGAETADGNGQKK